MSPREIFLLGYSFILLSQRHLKLYKTYPLLRKITWLYLGLLISQIVSEIAVGNAFYNASRGIMVTVMSYLHLLFLFSYFIKDRKYILFALAGIVLRLLIFGTEKEGSVEEVLSGEAAGFIKFYLLHLVTLPLLIASVLLLRKRKIAIVIVAAGLLLIILGARNGGATLALSGIITYLVLIGKTFKTRQVILTLSVTAILGYGLYAIYVNQVLIGKITSGNSEQILLLKNPYNPINLIFAGRTEILIGWQAFMDEPLFGHGSWTQDVTGKYRTLMASFRKDIPVVIAGSGRVIPSHSVLIGTGMYNGIFAFLFMFAILFFFIKTGFKTIDKKDPYIMTVIYSILFIIWNGMFSPVPHFRYTLPLYFAIILTSYCVIKSKNKPKIT